MLSMFMRGRRRVGAIQSDWVLCDLMSYLEHEHASI